MTSSVKPILTDDWSLVKSRCVASQDCKDPNTSVYWWQRAALPLSVRQESDVGRGKDEAGEWFSVVSVDAVRVLSVREEGHPACIRTCSTNPQKFLRGNSQRRRVRRNWFTWTNGPQGIENHWPLIETYLDRSSCSSSWKFLWIREKNKNRA